jgi:hypothetical protein
MEDKMTNKVEEEDGAVLMANYVVAFLDILGQKREMGECGLLSENEEEAKDLAKRFYRKIRNLQDWFNNFYQYSKQEPDISKVPEMFVEEFRAGMRSEIKFQRFSDGIMSYVALNMEIATTPLNGIYGLLATCGSICLMSLAHAQPVRAGVELSWAVEAKSDSGNELYGCAVACAYELESKVAKYPRVVVGKYLVEYLQYMQQIPLKTKLDEIAKSMSELCLNIISRDGDGNYFVDYLNPHFRNTDPEVHDEYRRQAFEFIKNQIRHFDEENEKKLLERYQILHDYFVSRG